MRGLFALFLPLGLLAAPLLANDPLPPSPRRTATAQPGMAGFTQVFFDAAGRRLGRLRIERVALESRLEGFLRVAWRPQLILEGVHLEIFPDAAWPETGRQILAALGGSADTGAVLRDLHLTIGGRSPHRISVPIARLRADGALELLPGSPPPAPAVQPQLFWLTGPHAGELRAANPAPRLVSSPPPAHVHDANVALP